MCVCVYTCLTFELNHSLSFCRAILHDRESSEINGELDCIFLCVLVAVDGVDVKERLLQVELLSTVRES